MATAIKLQEPVLSVAHLASSTPSYYVEEVEIGVRNVEVAYFDENTPDSELEYKTIPLQDLVDFTNEFYRAYTDAMIEGEHVQERLEIAGYDYLRDNLNAVTTDYLNQKM